MEVSTNFIYMASENHPKCIKLKVSLSLDYYYIFILIKSNNLPFSIFVSQGRSGLGV